MHYPSRTVLSLSNLIFHGALAVSSMLTAIFVATYPLNIGIYDAPNYLAMMSRNESNLIHASGYPFLISHLLRPFMSIPPFNTYPVPFLFKLLVVQHTINLATMTVCAFICRRLLGTFVAVGFVLFWGCSVFFMSTVSISQPEWLQADLIVLAGFLAGSAFFSLRLGWKIALYLSSAGILAVAYLVKFNSAPIGGFLIVFLLVETLPWIWRSMLAAGCAVLAGGIIGVYVVLFHLPTTGAAQLTFDHGWVLLEKIAALDKAALDHVDGIDTLRWQALSSVVPPDYLKGYAYRNLTDIAPPALAAPYRQQYHDIMAMTKSDLRTFATDHPLPSSFQLRYSFIPLYYYIGLPETDDLGIKVFIEYVNANRARFVLHVLRGFLLETPSRNWEPWVPTMTDPLDLTLERVDTEHLRVTGGEPWFGRRYFSTDSYLWRPGVYLFSALHTAQIGNNIRQALLVAMLIWICATPQGKQRQFVIAISFGVALYALFMHTVYFMRDKDAIAVWPIISLLWAIGALAIVRAVGFTIVRRRRRQ